MNRSRDIRKLPRNFSFRLRCLPFSLHSRHNRSLFSLYLFFFLSRSRRDYLSFRQDENWPLFPPREKSENNAGQSRCDLFLIRAVCENRFEIRRNVRTYEKSFCKLWETFPVYSTKLWLYNYNKLYLTCQVWWIIYTYISVSICLYT